MTALPIADHWFERTTIDHSITLLWEPHVVPLMRCNIWHIRGRDRDLVVDTGMGLMSLSDELADLVDKPVTAVATHGHDDHIGGHHEFTDVRVHPDEAAAAAGPSDHVAGATRSLGRCGRRCTRGCRVPDDGAVLRHRPTRRCGSRLVPPGTGRPCAPHRGRRRDRPRRPLLRSTSPPRTLAGLDRAVGANAPARCSRATRSTTVRCSMSWQSRRSPTTAPRWIGCSSCRSTWFTAATTPASDVTGCASWRWPTCSVGGRDVGAGAIKACQGRTRLFELSSPERGGGPNDDRFRLWDSGGGWPLTAVGLDRLANPRQPPLEHLTEVGPVGSS